MQQDVNGKLKDSTWWLLGHLRSFHSHKELNRSWKSLLRGHSDNVAKDTPSNRILQATSSDKVARWSSFQANYFSVFALTLCKTSTSISNTFFGQLLLNVQELLFLQIIFNMFWRTWQRRQMCEKSSLIFINRVAQMIEITKYIYNIPSSISFITMSS